ncbi:MAG: carbohydrate ABC transporter permease [Spirochaetia bacterium]|jgi:multiple sugar transport system permease protein|nr:carbohydrate ABC transporter permease [Spirochaetia bacterium]
MKKHKYSIKRTIGLVLILTALALLLVWTVIPIYIVISNSFRKTLEMKLMPPKIVFEPIFTHYQKLLTLDRFGIYFRNSAIISISTTAFTIILGSMAAYGLKICKSAVGRRISNVLLLGKMVPSITILIPLFMMMNRAHLTGTYLAPILTLSCLSLPFVTWLMTGFIADIPNELIEAASIEGCCRINIFTRIIFPLLRPAIASAVILVMQSSWNELMFSLQLTNLKTYPLTVGIARYVGAVSVDWGKCSAAATITMAPIIIIGFFMQKYLVSGMTAGAVKG